MDGGGGAGGGPVAAAAFEEPYEPAILTLSNMNDFIRFSSHFAVCKFTEAPRRTHHDVWAGFLDPSGKKEVVWDSGPPTMYGPHSTEDQAFYSDACLAEDVANGKRLYEAIAGLMFPPKAAVAPAAVVAREGDGGEKKKKKVEKKKEKKEKTVMSPSEPLSPLDEAIEHAARFYGKKPLKKRPVWLTWLEGCIRVTTGKLFHFHLCAAHQGHPHDQLSGPAPPRVRGRDHLKRKRGSEDPGFVAFSSAQSDGLDPAEVRALYRATRNW